MAQDGGYLAAAPRSVPVDRTDRLHRHCTLDRDVGTIGNVLHCFRSEIGVLAITVVSQR